MHSLVHNAYSEFCKPFLSSDSVVSVGKSSIRSISAIGVITFFFWNCGNAVSVKIHFFYRKCPSLSPELETKFNLFQNEVVADLKNGAFQWFIEINEP